MRKGHGYGYGYGVGLALLLLLCMGASVRTAVIRPEAQEEATTISSGPADAVEASTTVEPEVTTASVAQSRDKDATVKIGWASVDPAPGTVDGDLSVGQMKSAKLLLLSTPARRPAEVEQQFEEPDDSDASATAGSGDSSLPTTTEVSTTTEYSEPPTTTAATTTATTTTVDEQASEQKTTKLFAINATISSEDAVQPNVAVAVATDNTTIAIAEQPQAPSANNVAIELALVEPEADYVLLDGSLTDLSDLTSSSTHDELQLGSFTHIDSDVHLQPVVHSVEIVPTSLDDPLIVNYVHNLR
ncbi:hypothetical protein AWZ03_009494 [Drosophila navojoa]|uniref:Folded gastrulation N-terminal domain-containing protein n=1 Tax=Drosophila navojoa TaxID=7232 RepID=A0A484B5Z5_DRONA|nr:uncharacterized protein LOC108650300 [Drosophila navojoa]TDG44069.1 hypothetical protein AWZ03_009494 [Drosophila navojoa]